ncbi:MAG: DUF2937 family protein [Bacteroidota bacterium]
MKLLRAIIRLLDRGLAVAFALIFVQIPVSMDLYEQVLVEAKDRVKPIYEDVEFRALNENFADKDEYLDELAREAANPDSVQLVRNSVHRYEEYIDAIATLEAHEFWERPWYIFKVYRSTIWQSVDYTPGIIWTWEGLAYAGLGILVYSLLLLLLWRIVGGKPRKQPVTSSQSSGSHTPTSQADNLSDTTTSQG